MLVQLMRTAKVKVVFANMSMQMESLFRAHKVITADDVVIPELDDALEWCEEQVLSRWVNYTCVLFVVWWWRCWRCWCWF
jgi:hypothetical protein